MQYTNRVTEFFFYFLSMKLLLICNFYSFFFEGLGEENVIVGFRSNINKLII